MSIISRLSKLEARQTAVTGAAQIEWLSDSEYEARRDAGTLAPTPPGQNIRYIVTKNPNFVAPPDATIIRVVYGR